MKASAFHFFAALGLFTVAAVPCFSADTVIYSNSVYSGYSTAPGSNTDVYDFGTSPGGLVSKFNFGYRNAYLVTNWARVSFYLNPQLAPYDRDPGDLVKTIVINNLPATSSSYGVYEYVLPEAERFELASGYFCYSIAVGSNNTGLALASGGAGQQDELWEYRDDWLNGWGYYPFWFNSTPWAGLYMEVYTIPEPATLLLVCAGAMILRKRK